MLSLFFVYAQRYNFFPSAFFNPDIFPVQIPFALAAQEGRCCSLTPSLLTTKQAGFLMGLQISTCTQVAQHRNNSLWCWPKARVMLFVFFPALTAWIFKRRKENTVLVCPGAKEQLPSGVKNCLTSISLPFSCRCFILPKKVCFPCSVIYSTS